MQKCFVTTIGIVPLPASVPQLEPSTCLISCNIMPLAAIYVNYNLMYKYKNSHKK